VKSVTLENYHFMPARAVFEIGWKRVLGKTWNCGFTSNRKKWTMNRDSMCRHPVSPARLQEKWRRLGDERAGVLLVISGIIFGLVALVPRPSVSPPTGGEDQTEREIPMWVSVGGLVVAAGLCFWAFWLLR